jgi:hypothetical protein
MLREYVEAEILRPYDMGEGNCAHFMAGWVKRVTGRDGLAIFDGLDAEISTDFVRRGRLLRTVYEGCRSIDLKRSKGDPEPTDIGVIKTGPILRCAILGEHGWLFRGERGVGSAPLNFAVPLMHWKVH